MFEAYHGDVPSESIVFDTNRSWTSKVPLLADLYPQTRIICCVRDVAWVIDSIEKMIRQNPLEMARFVSAKVGGTIYSRVTALMDSETGLIGVTFVRLGFLSKQIACLSSIMIISFEVRRKPW